MNIFDTGGWMTGGVYTRTYTYRLDRRINPGKLRQLESLYAEAARVRHHFNQTILTLWQSTGVLPSALNYNDVPTAFRDKLHTSLPTNLQTALLHQLLGQHKSWAANVKNRFTLTIQRTSSVSCQCYLLANGLLPADATAEQVATAVSAFKHQLHWINRLQQWSVPFNEQQAYLASAKQRALESGKATPALEALTIHASRLARKWFESYLRRFKRPSVGELPLPLTQLTGLFDAPVRAKRNKAVSVPHWLRLSTLTSGQRIELPFLANPYATQKVQSGNGWFAKSMALHRKPNGTFYLHRYGQFEATAALSSDSEIGCASESVKDLTSSLNHRSQKLLAIDLGLNNLFATSEGDLEGVGYLKQLQHYDYDLQRITTGLQGAGVVRYGSCKRYQQKVKQIRGFIKTTVDTAIKRILDRHQPQVLIVESLSFKSSKLSRRMNRLLQSFGKGAFEKALVKYQEERGIQVEKIPAAYTSQGCKSCSFVSAKNRHGNQFQCLVCGKRAHADVNAAKMLLKRFQQHGNDKAMRYLPYTQWWSVLFQQHVEIINRLPLSRSRMIDYAKLAYQGVSSNKRKDLLAVLINRTSSNYGSSLYQLVQNP